MTWRCLAPFGFALALAACGPSAEQREARQLLAELDRLRDADDAHRLPLLEQLERATPQTTTAEAARKDCAAAYRALHQSTLLEASVRARLGAVAPTSSAQPPPDTLRIVADLADAEAQLDRARELMPHCEKSLAALRQLSRGAEPK